MLKFKYHQIYGIEVFCFENSSIWVYVVWILFLFFLPEVLSKFIINLWKQQSHLVAALELSITLHDH